MAQECTAHVGLLSSSRAQHPGETRCLSLARDGGKGETAGASKGVQVQDARLSFGKLLVDQDGNAETLSSRELCSCSWPRREKGRGKQRPGEKSGGLLLLLLF